MEPSSCCAGLRPMSCRLAPRLRSRLISRSCWRPCRRSLAHGDAARSVAAGPARWSGPRRLTARAPVGAALPRWGSPCSSRSLIGRAAAPARLRRHAHIPSAAGRGRAGRWSTAPDGHGSHAATCARSRSRPAVRQRRATGVHGWTPFNEQHLVLIDVSDAGQVALIEQRLADRASSGRSRKRPDCLGRHPSRGRAGRGRGARPGASLVGWCSPAPGHGLGSRSPATRRCRAAPGSCARDGAPPRSPARFRYQLPSMRRWLCRLRPDCRTG